jgi:DNA polymerase-1
MPRGELRYGFIAPPGYVLIGADMSQIELRMMAHWSRDPVLIEAYMKDMDIHTRTGALVVSQAGGNRMTEAHMIEVRKLAKQGVKHPDLPRVEEIRQQAKPVNFGMIYGMNPYTLQTDMANKYDVFLDIEDVKDIHSGYFQTYAGVKRWHAKQEKFVKEHGYVETMFNMKRPVPDIYSEDWSTYRAACRVAYNTPIQGSSGEIMSMNLIELDKRGYEILAQVHDEVLVQVPEDKAEPAMKEVEEIMCTTDKLCVPLKSEVKMGRSWGDVH